MLPQFFRLTNRRQTTSTITKLQRRIFNSSRPSQNTSSNQKTNQIDENVTITTISTNQTQSLNPDNQHFPNVTNTTTNTYPLTNHLNRFKLPQFQELTSKLQNFHKYRFFTLYTGGCVGLAGTTFTALRTVTPITNSNDDQNQNQTLSTSPTISPTYQALQSRSLTLANDVFPSNSSGGNNTNQYQQQLQSPTLGMGQFNPNMSPNSSQSSQQGTKRPNLLNFNTTPEAEEFQEATKNDPEFEDLHPAEPLQLGENLNDFIDKLESTKKKTPNQIHQDWLKEQNDVNYQIDLMDNRVDISEFERNKRIAILSKLFEHSEDEYDEHGNLVWKNDKKPLTLEEATKLVEDEIDAARKKRDPNYLTEDEFQEKVSEKAREIIKSHEKPLLPSETLLLFPHQNDPYLRPYDPNTKQLLTYEYTDVEEQPEDITDDDGAPKPRFPQRQKRRSHIIHEKKDLELDYELLSRIEDWFKIHIPDAQTSPELSKHLLNTPVPEEFRDKRELYIYFENRQHKLQHQQNKRAALDSMRDSLVDFIESGMFEAFKLNLFEKYHNWEYYFIPAEPMDAFEPQLPPIQTYEELLKKIVYNDDVSLTPDEMNQFETAIYYFDKWLQIIISRPELLDMVEEIQLEDKISDTARKQIELTQKTFQLQEEFNSQGENEIGLDPSVFNVFIKGIEKLVTPKQDIEEFRRIKAVDSYKQNRAAFEAAVLEYQAISAVLAELDPDDHNMVLLKRKKKLVKKKMKKLHDKFELGMRIEGFRNEIDDASLQDIIDEEFERILETAEYKLVKQMKTYHDPDFDLDQLIQPVDTIYGEKTKTRELLEEALVLQRRTKKQFENEKNRLENDPFLHIKTRTGAEPVLIHIDDEMAKNLSFGSKAVKQAQKRAKAIKPKTIDAPAPLTRDDFRNQFWELKKPKEENEINFDNDDNDDDTGILGVDSATIPGTKLLLQRVYNPNTNTYAYFAESEADKEVYTEYVSEMKKKHEKMLQLRQLSRAREHTRMRADIAESVRLGREKQKQLELERKSELLQELQEKGFSPSQIEGLIDQYDLNVELPSNLQEIFQRYQATDQFSANVQDQLDPRMVAAYEEQLAELEAIFEPAGKRLFQKFVTIMNKAMETLSQSDHNLVKYVRSLIAKDVPAETDVFGYTTRNSFCVEPEYQLTINIPPPPETQFSWPSIIEELLVTMSLDQNYERITIPWSPYTFLNGYNHETGREEFEIFARTGPAHPIQPRPAPALPFSQPLSDFFSPQTAMTLFGVIHYGPYTLGPEIEAFHGLDDKGVKNYKDTEITNYSFDPINPPQPWDDINNRLEFFQLTQSIHDEQRFSIDLTRDIDFDTDPWLDDDFFIEVQNKHAPIPRQTQRERILAAMELRGSTKPVHNMLTDQLGLTTPQPPEFAVLTEIGTDPLHTIPLPNEPEDIVKEFYEFDKMDQENNTIPIEMKQNETNINSLGDDNGYSILSWLLGSNTDTTPLKEVVEQEQEEEKTEEIVIEVDGIQGLDEGMMMATLNQFARATITADNKPAKLNDSVFQMLTYSAIDHRVPFFCVTSLEYVSELPPNGTLFEQFPPKTSQVEVSIGSKGLDGILDSMWSGFEEGVSNRAREEGLDSFVFDPPHKPVQNPVGAIVSSWLFSGSLSTPVAKLISNYELLDYYKIENETQQKLFNLTQPSLVPHYRYQCDEGKMIKYVAPFLHEIILGPQNQNGTNNDVKNPKLKSTAQLLQEEQLKQQKLLQDAYDKQKANRIKMIKRKVWPQRLKEDIEESSNEFFINNPIQIVLDYVKDKGLTNPLYIPVSVVKKQQQDGNNTAEVSNTNMTNEQNKLQPSTSSSTSSSSTPSSSSLDTIEYQPALQTIESLPPSLQNELKSTYDTIPKMALQNPNDYYILNPYYLQNEELLQDKQAYETFLNETRVQSYIKHEGEKYLERFRDYKSKNAIFYHWPRTKPNDKLHNEKDLTLEELIQRITNTTSSPLSSVQSLLQEYNSCRDLLTTNSLWAEQLQAYYQHEKKLDYYLPFIPVKERHSNPYRYAHFPKQDRPCYIRDDQRLLYHAWLIVMPDKLLSKSDINTKRHLAQLYSDDAIADVYYMQDLIDGYDFEAEEEKRRQERQLKRQQKEQQQQNQVQQNQIEQNNNNNWFGNLWGLFG